MLNAIRKFLRDEDGSEMVEWAVVAGLLIVTGAGAFVLIGEDASIVFDALENTTDAAALAAQAAS